MTTQSTFDPQLENAQARIKILDRAAGRKEFILPALRNFNEKMSFAFLWLVMAGCFLVVIFVKNRVTANFPTLVRFFIVDHTYYALAVLGFIQLVLTIAVFDIWFRSSRTVATADNLQVITRWIFFKRVLVIPTEKIIETKTTNKTTVNTTSYYDLVGLATGEKPGWPARNFPPQRRAESSFTENDLKVFATGGKKIVVANNIQGEPQAQRLLEKLRTALNVKI